MMVDDPNNPTRLSVSRTTKKGEITEEYMVIPMRKVKDLLSTIESTERDNVWFTQIGERGLNPAVQARNSRNAGRLDAVMILGLRQESD